MIDRQESVPFVNPTLTEADQEQFLDMLPAICAAASFAFRGKQCDEREEMTAEVVANAFLAFSRLIARGKRSVIFRTVLARHAVKQVLHGRRIAAPQNVNDIGSPRCQRQKGVSVLPMHKFDPAHGRWTELLIADRRASPADLAATRIDFASWLRHLPSTKRLIAKSLATGEKTSAVAKRFRLSQGRISQVRQELQLSWQAFHGEPVIAAA